MAIPVYEHHMLNLVILLVPQMQKTLRPQCHLGISPKKRYIPVKMIHKIT